MTVAVVTDSTADLPLALREAEGIRMVPLSIEVLGRTMLDQVEIDPVEYLERLPALDPLPHTSAPPPGAFRAAFQEALAEGAEGVLSVHLSGALSATVQVAESARTMVEGPVRVVDGRSAGLGTGLLAWWAARSARAGTRLEETTAEVRSLLGRLMVAFCPLTLSYLARGGRIGPAARWVGTVLDVKPVLTVEEGRIVPFMKVRGERQVIPALIQAVRRAVPDGAPVLLGVSHAANPEAAARLREVAHATWEIVDELTTVVGPVLSTHGGPGTFGLMVLMLNPVEAARWRAWSGRV